MQSRAWYQIEPRRHLPEKFDTRHHQAQSKVAADTGYHIVSAVFRLVVTDADKTARTIVKMEMPGPVQMRIPQPVDIQEQEIVEIVSDQNVGGYAAVSIELHGKPCRVSDLKTDAKTRGGALGAQYDREMNKGRPKEANLPKLASAIDIWIFHD